MLEIIVDPRRTFALKRAITEAIESGDYDSLLDDVRDCFTDEQVEQIEELLEDKDINESIDEIVAEWGGDDVDELFEAIESFFAELKMDIHFDEDEDFVEEEEDEDGEDYFDDETDEESFEDSDED